MGRYGSPEHHAAPGLDVLQGDVLGVAAALALELGLLVGEVLEDLVREKGRVEAEPGRPA